MDATTPAVRQLYRDAAREAKAGRLQQAVAAYSQILSLLPGAAEAHNGLGTVLRALGRPEAAMVCFGRAIQAAPMLVEPYVNLSDVLREQGQAQAAATMCRRALELRPDFVPALVNLGLALQAGGELDAAEASLRRAVALAPDQAAAIFNLGTLLAGRMRTAEAEACFRRAIAWRADFAEAHFNLGMTLLRQGALDEGWREYEWRWGVAQMAPDRRDFAVPQWRGEPASGKTLLVHAEQGLGDTLQFCRYAPIVAARGIRVVLEVQPPLVTLCRSLAGVTAVIARGETLPDVDWHCPLLSLPAALGTTLATIPAELPYLHPDPERVGTWRARLPMDRPLIGLAWAGSPLHKDDRRRSVDFTLLSPLLALPGFRFVSLQKGPAAAAAGGSPLLDLTDAIGDFADTAALIASLDRVIAVDTAVAHLAACLGKPVWLLDRFDADWRWLDGRSDSPWYPTLRIFRQPAPGQWSPVIAAVIDALARPGRSAEPPQA